jgi:hypothetical protein
MILLQASICWSAGVFSLVHSGPSCARDCAEAGCDHSAARSHAKSNAKTGIGDPSTSSSIRQFVAGRDLGFKAVDRPKLGLFSIGQMVVGHWTHKLLPTAVPSSPA